MHQRLGNSPAESFASPVLSLPRVALYVWGHGRPQPGTTRLGCGYSLTAAGYASAHGWREEDFAAWAFEVQLLGSWSAVLQELAPQLERDPAVAGWAIHWQRSAGAV